MPVGVIALGSHLPERIISNADISSWTGATPAWIEERTGVLERRYASPGTTTSDLAARAAAEALAGPGVCRERLAALVVATCTPDSPQPSTAAVTQHKLGLAGVPAFDVNAVCSGFLYALTVAEGLLLGRMRGEQILVAGADMFSTVMDRTDRKTVSLFGDGAGAVVLGEVPEGYGIGAVRLVTDGALHHLVGIEAGGTRTPLDAAARAAGAHLFRMDGRAVRDYALATLDKVVGQALGDTGLGLDDIDRFVFHQANTRLLETFAKDAGVPADRLVLTAPRTGNTAAASVPLTLHEAHRRRPLRRGERILLAAIGGGMTAGALLLTWY